MARRKRSRKLAQAARACSGLKIRAFRACLRKRLTSSRHPAVRRKKRRR